MILFNTYLGNKEIHAFLKDISPKMKVIAWLEFEDVFYEAV